MSKSVERMSSIFLSGWHTCCGGFELLPEFCGADYQPLDASYFVPTGGMSRVNMGNGTERPVASSCNDLLLARSGLG